MRGAAVLVSNRVHVQFSLNITTKELHSLLVQGVVYDR